ncbi:hypothetical protein [Deinococcus roseus]|uniref:Uncharacterized protein n=1 Tax=Deinococcus roseus TaxID=392414 RepID=A0ABQ2D814_9DEIO|nr:hypothetical protein [Deinococcus roseus]GGJ48634.1 hypothetical protein GCM10008938_38330 [Deinococcus roseus]
MFVLELLLVVLVALWAARQIQKRLIPVRLRTDEQNRRNRSRR